MSERMFTRGIAIPSHRPKSFDDSRNAVRVVAVTENPVKVWDWDRKSSIKEILLIDGAHLPPSGQIPLLDSHNRSSVSSVLGSARNFTPNGNILECDVYFSSTEPGKNAALNVKEGHLTDFSVGYFPAESDYIPVGEEKNINGRQFKGPVKVTTKWNLRELSLTPIGADQNATARSQDSGASEQPIEEPPSAVPQADTAKEPDILPAIQLPETQESNKDKPAPEEVKQESQAPALSKPDAAQQEDMPPEQSVQAEPKETAPVVESPVPQSEVEQDIKPEPQQEQSQRQAESPPQSSAQASAQEIPAQPVSIIDIIFYIFIGIMVFFLLKGLFF